MSQTLIPPLLERNLPQRLTDKRFVDGRLIQRGPNIRVFDAQKIDSSTPGIDFDREKPDRRPVRITLLSDHAGASLKQQFISSARLQESLDHPGITSILDVFDEDKLTAYVEEKFDGMTLEEILALSPNPMNTERIKSIMSSICAAVSYCHKLHVVHGAIRPKAINIVWLAGLESTKLSSFGSNGTMIDIDVNSTDDDLLINRLSYLPPEQNDRRSPASPQSDIYALGVLLYRMATGSLPFKSNRAAELKEAHRSLAPRRPSQIVSSINEDLDNLAMKAMNKDPRDRWTSVDQFLENLMSLSVMRVSPLIEGDTHNAMREHSSIINQHNSANATPFGEAILQNISLSTKTSPGTNIPTANSTDEITSVLPEMRSSQSQHATPSSRFRPVARQITRETTRSSGKHDSHSLQTHSSSTEQLPQPFSSQHAKKIALAIPDATAWKQLIRQDSSETTVFIPMPNPPQIGESIRLSIRVNNGPRFMIRGVVGWRRHTRDSRIESGAGMKVLHSDEDTLGYVSGWFEGEKKERRQIRRLPIKLQLTYQSQRGDKHLTITKDLNKWGMFLQGRAELNLGDTLDIELFAPGKISAYVLKGAVSRIVEGELDFGFGVALTFESGDLRARYHRLINDLEAEFFAGTLSEDLLF